MPLADLLVWQLIRFQRDFQNSRFTQGYSRYEWVDGYVACGNGRPPNYTRLSADLKLQPIHMTQRQLWSSLWRGGSA